MTTVAAFFRDPDVQAGLTTAPPDRARLILKQFFDLYTLDACANASQFLAVADLAFRAKEFTASRDAIARALKAGGSDDTAFSKLGRLEAEIGKPQAALDAYVRGTTARPKFPYNWIGAARMALLLGRKDEAAAYALTFCGFGQAPHQKTELEAIGELADFIFDKGTRRESLKLYEAVHKFGLKKNNLMVRLGEAYIASDQPARAVALLGAPYEKKELDIWARRALAHALSLTGNHIAALNIARALIIERPDNESLVASYFDMILRTRNPGVLRAELRDRGAALTGPAAIEASVRLALADGDAMAAVDALGDAPLKPQTRLLNLCFELTYALLDANQVDRAERLVARVEAAAPGDAVALQIRIDLLFRLQHWEQAGLALAKLPAELAEKPQMRLKRFEYAAFMRDHATATSLLAQMDADPARNRQHMLPILRYLAEAGDWNGLLDRALIWLGADFRYAQIGYVLFRAARRTNRHAALIAAIAAIPDSAESTDLQRLCTDLRIDMAGDAQALSDVLADGDITADPALARRLSIRRDIAERAAGIHQRRAIFLCSDRTYLGASAVALCSAIAHGGLENIDVYLAVDDDMLDETEHLARTFRARGINIRVLAASDIAADPAALSGAYGLFTSGHRLSSAAYYRIFCARFLQGFGTYARAIYIDCDVLIRQPLNDLFNANLNGHPMAARIEKMRPEVRRAINLHKIEGDRYFNSGVLLFDLTHPGLIAALDATIDAIADDTVQLLYHDQCALNLGFRNSFADLDLGFNFPMVESTPLAEMPENTAILHFLDRPKPWSNAYRGDAADLWYTAWRDTAAIIGEKTAMDLLAATTE